MMEDDTVDTFSDFISDQSDYVSEEEIDRNFFTDMVDDNKDYSDNMIYSTMSLKIVRI